ncbi:MAG: serine hydrolase, partial [Opitutales bacterium]|nr:serine hydrolase [Opitutales bacterium]
FGTGGDAADMEAEAQTANGQYRVTGPCSEIVEGTENIDLSDCSYSLPSCKEVDVSEPSQVGLNPKNLAELSEWFLEKKDLPIFSLLIARENKLVYELYSGDVKPEMSHYLFSTTKSVTSALVGAAIAEGKISGVDVPISQIIPSKLFSSPEQQKRWDAVTLKNALGMSAHSVATPPHDNSPEAYARQERLNVHNRLTMVLGQDIMENPGEKFLYNDLTPYLVSGALAYNVGTDLLTYGGQTIFGKLGFRNAAWLHQDPSGLDIGGYGLKLRPVDMLKFGLTYLNEGVYKGKRILPKEWVDLAYKPYMPPDVETPYYGYYWWKGWYQHNGVVYETIEANGWRGQHIVIMPKLKLVLVATHYLNDEDDKKDLKRLYLEKYILPAILEKPRLTAEDKEWSSKILTYNSQIQKGPSRFPENGEERVRPGYGNRSKRIPFNFSPMKILQKDDEECSFIYTAADCATEAIAKGLRIRGEGYDFEGDYGTKGCYAYDSGTYEGIAFFGTGGDAADMEAEAQTTNGQYRVTGPCSAEDTAVTEARTTPVPQAFALMQNYPNPFNSSTVIHFDLPTSDIVDLSIYNIAGQQVATLAQGMRQAGTHVINWNGNDDNEHALASGLYFYRLQSSTQQQTRKLLLLR